MELENERVLGLELEGKYAPELAGNKKMLKTTYLVDKQDKIIKTKFMKYDVKYAVFTATMNCQNLSYKCFENGGLFIQLDVVVLNGETTLCSGRSRELDLMERRRQKERVGGGVMLE